MRAATESGSTPRFEVWGVPGIPEVRPGDDLVGLLVTAVQGIPNTLDSTLADGDIVVVTSKIVSKAEGRIVAGMARDEAIDAETVRTVSEWATPHGRTRIAETKHGLVMAAAGVDASNVDAGHVVLLPEDPDKSARRLQAGLRERLGVRVGVILTDTAGRAWRNGVVDMAVGAAGVAVLDDLRGRTDRYGNDLGVTVVAIADEVAAATELVRTKLSALPVAIVRGLSHLVRSDEPAALPDHAHQVDTGASALVRPASEDRFRLGTPEAMREAVFARRSFRPTVPDASVLGTSGLVQRAQVHRALEAALRIPSPDLPAHRRQATGALPPVRFVLVESEAFRKALASALSDADYAATLTAAPYLIVPCLDGERPTKPETLVDVAATLAVGAAVENMLIALSVDGLGGTWMFPTEELSAAVSATLRPPGGWTPMGIVAIGPTGDTSGDDPNGGCSAHDLDELTVTR